MEDIISKFKNVILALKDLWFVIKYKKIENVFINGEPSENFKFKEVPKGRVNCCCNVSWKHRITGNPPGCNWKANSIT